jgi:hypothetical protein
VPELSDLTLESTGKLRKARLSLHGFVDWKKGHPLVPPDEFSVVIQFHSDQGQFLWTYSQNVRTGETQHIIGEDFDWWHEETEPGLLEFGLHVDNTVHFVWGRRFNEKLGADTVVASVEVRDLDGRPLSKTVESNAVTGHF